MLPEVTVLPTVIVAGAGLATRQLVYRRRRARRLGLRDRVAELAKLPFSAETEQQWQELRGRCSKHQLGEVEINLIAVQHLAREWTRRGRLAEAVEALRSGLAGPRVKAERQQSWRGQGQLAELLVIRGHHPEGVHMARVVVDQCTERWGAESPITLDARDQLGRCRCQGGAAEDAVPVLTELLAVRERISGSESRAAAATRLRLAEARLSLGELDAAEAGLREVIAVLDAGAGKSGDTRTAVRSALAELAARRGRAEEAIAEFTAVLATLRRAYGEDAPRVLRTRFRLAELRSDREEHEAVLAARIRVLGADHPDTAASRAAVSGGSGVTLAGQD